MARQGPMHAETTRFRRDVLWNLGAFAVVGASGIALNMVIARMWDASALGAFNQVLTFHILLGQIAACGIHMSVLKYVSEYVDDPAKVRPIVVAALLPALPLGLLASLLTWALAGWFGGLLDSPVVTAGLVAIAPAIGLFAINKILANVLNGLRAMRLFALAQATRPVTLLSCTIIAGFCGISGTDLAWTVTVTELALLGLLGASVAAVLPRTTQRTGAGGAWLSAHLRFGVRAAVAGWISEANSRVDVLVVGLFASDRVVGIYSAASTIIEGLVQLPAVLRNNVNPLIARQAAQGERTALGATIRRASWLAAAAMLPVCAFAIFIYPLFADFVLGDAQYRDAWVAFSMAAAGVAAAAWMMPMESFLNQVGSPGHQTLYKLAVLVVNIVALACLVPVMGMTGAGAASAITFVTSSVILQIVVMRHLARMP